MRIPTEKKAQLYEENAKQSLAHFSDEELIEELETRRKVHKFNTGEKGGGYLFNCDDAITLTKTLSSNTKVLVIPCD